MNLAKPGHCPVSAPANNSTRALGVAGGTWSSAASAGPLTPRDFYYGAKIHSTTSHDE